MKVSLNWIRDYVDLPKNIDMKELAHALTMRTVEVEGYENPATKLENIVVARIDKLEAHPNADKLRVCQCYIGEEELVQVVCGGSNLYEGELVVLALPGAEVVWHGEGEPVKIKAGKLRGVASNGMICAASELGLDELFPAKEEHEIVDLSNFDIDGLEAGAKLGEALDLDDIIIEIDNKSMTHRPDLWGHYGLARELAAIYGLELKKFASDRVNELSLDKLENFSLKIQDADKCRRYMAVLIDNVEVSESPFWMKKRLVLTGMRPINNIVDISNYVMLASGQPTHTFDADHVEGAISVRQAQKGEKLILLDGKELELSTADLIIADDKKPLALAGIMGGKNDSIFPDTKRIVLEIANFDPMTVRQSQQRYQQRTESSTRFEKSIDTARVDMALSCFVDCFNELMPSAIYKQYSNLSLKETKVENITVKKDFLQSRSGKEISYELLNDTLSPLEFKVQAVSEDEFVVTPPIFRSTGDIEDPYDILEELCRMLGYENFSFQAPTVELNHAVAGKDRDMRRSISEYMAFSCGFTEVVSYPWIHERFQKPIIENFNMSVSLEAPPSPETRYLRQSLIPALISITEHNAKFMKEFQIFESSQVFRKSAGESEETVQQIRELAALVLCDELSIENKFREMKTTILNLPIAALTAELDFVRVKRPYGSDVDTWLNIVNKNPDRRYKYCEEDIIGNLYLLSQAAHKQADLKKSLMLVFDLNLDELKLQDSRNNKYQQLSSILPVEENLSMIFDENVYWSDIEKSISSKVSDLKFIEEYRGKQIPDGKKSVHFSFTLSGKDASLTMEEIDNKLRKIIRTLENDLNASLRA